MKPAALTALSIAATVPAYSNDVDVTAGHLYFRAEEVLNP